MQGRNLDGNTCIWAGMSVKKGIVKGRVKKGG